jgi:hypothetical protein
MRTLLLTAGLLCAARALPVMADQRPLMVPTRDVDVTYAMVALGSGGKPVELSQRLRWDVAAGRLRVDPPVRGVYMLMDYHTHRLLAVRDAQRSVLEMPADLTSVAPGLARGTSFVRRGEDTVAGIKCTEWDTQDSSGQATTVCLTDDGVLLRAKTSARVLVEATHVTYAPIDPSLFQVPDGYQHVTPR